MITVSHRKLTVDEQNLNTRHGDLGQRQAVFQQLHEERNTRRVQAFRGKIV